MSDAASRLEAFAWSWEEGAEVDESSKATREDLLAGALALRKLEAIGAFIVEAEPLVVPPFLGTAR